MIEEEEEEERRRFIMIYFQTLEKESCITVDTDNF
jgi:hypothetical protein